ncbi:pyruvate carboxylase [Kineococcus sp. NPDC059986]|uniref:pyruvate carboxylase n=1 Tax=Kineococcus sp. NPDC059986 TaxID=3155538 RepID=UPI00344FCFB8
MFSKVLVANRGEIAVRAFRAAYELGARTVAVFAHEDRASVHRLKADESYLIGERGHPVRAYLDVDEIVRVARASGADAVYPGYGFLSENPDLARACAEHGITFVGPPPGVLEMAGNKVTAVAAARAAGIATNPSSAPSADPDELVAAAEAVGFPVFVKAVAGGGGRGMRLVETPAALPDALAAAMREADGAFGDPTVFLERAVLRPRHVEVQVLADATGEVVHLFERDCSLQRRHQKVIELAPAPNLDEAVRRRLHADAVAFARAIGYVNAGTVEFLVATAGERAGEHAFIEMNPRIQVEHTVTEEITDVDLVQSQLRIAAGETLADLELSQDTLQVRGAALQCRITTEDPANGFRPDTGRISAYRSAGGAGVRLDEGNAVAGGEVSAHFDSMLVKLSCRGRDFATAAARARRALAEFRIRGVTTNISFLQAVLEDPDFLAGRVDTGFIADRPDLAVARTSNDRGTRLLTFLADVTVNQPHGPAPKGAGRGSSPVEKLPRTSTAGAPPAGSKQRLDQLGAAGFAAWLRAEQRVHVTDTTFRDAHQSLLATRVRTRDLLAVAPTVARTLPDLLSLECWGGATYDVALRFLGEDPWHRLAALREAVPNIALQMLLRGRNTVGYTPYPTEVTDAFVAEAAATGVDVFRIFDALNDVAQVEPAVKAVRQTPAVAEVALCYTGDLADPAETLYTLDYYLRLAEQFVRAGGHVLAVKDMAGLLRPAAATRLVSALRREFDLPVHLHTHDTAGGQLATLTAAIAAGVDAVDVANAALSGTTSQPSMSALVAATAHTERETPLDLRAATDLEPYFEAVRRVYAPFESGLPGPTGRVYDHEIPGGQLSNLRQQAIALGLGERFEQIEATYAAADRILGRLVKVTPSSKVVGDLALQLVAQGVDTPEAFAKFADDPAAYDVPDSVIGFLAGDLGTPPGGWPEPFRSKALAGRTVKPATAALAAEDAALLAVPGRERQKTLNRLLFPGPTKEYETHRATYGDTSVLDTLDALHGLRHGVEHVIHLEPGVDLIAGLEAVSDVDDHGMRTVLATLNGQLRPLQVRDRSVTVDVKAAEKADPTNPTHVAAPYAGTVTLQVAAGDTVEAGQVVATIEAMKMEAAITAPRAGTVTRLALDGVQNVDGGDLVLLVS